MPTALSKGRAPLGEELRTLGKLLFLFDANDLNSLYSNTASVNYWPDSSGNGFGVSQTGTARPTFYPNFDTFGNAAVRFGAGGGQHMIMADNDNMDNLLAGAPITTFIYGRSLYNGLSQAIWSKYTSGGNAGPLFRYRNIGATEIYAEYLSTNAADSVQYNVYGSTDCNGVNSLAIIDYTPTSVAHSFINGSVDTLVTSAGGSGLFAGNSSSFYIGALNAGGVTQFLNGDIYILGCYIGALDTTTRRALEIGRAHV